MFLTNSGDLTVTQTNTEQGSPEWDTFAIEGLNQEKRLELILLYNFIYLQLYI